jgi:hypothetical protein
MNQESTIIINIHAVMTVCGEPILDDDDDGVYIH